MLQSEIQTTQGLTEVHEFGLDMSNRWPRERLDECDGGGGSADLYLKQEEVIFYEFYGIKMKNRE